MSKDDFLNTQLNYLSN